MLIYSAAGLTARAQTRDLLALAVRDAWGLSPLPEIALHEGGKPYFPGHPGLHFNLSHSGDLALCALDSAPVGVDVQLVKERRPSLPRRACSGSELAWLEEQPDFWSAFTLLWTLKEARVKESGRGLPPDLRNIRAPLPSEQPVLLDGLWFRTWSGPGWAAAVCGHSEPPEEFLEKALDLPQSSRSE